MSKTEQADSGKADRSLFLDEKALKSLINSERVLEISLVDFFSYYFDSFFVGMSFVRYYLG